MDIQATFASQFNITKAELRLLMKSCNSTELYTCLELLRAKKHRSSFRASMSALVRQWLLANATALESNSVHLIPKPLSRRQFEKSIPSWPTLYQIPASVDVVSPPVTCTCCS